jgi:hypothetical protein
MKVVDESEHLFLGSVDRDRPLHAEGVRFGSGKGEKSDNYDQDQERYLENHRFCHLTLFAPRQFATVQLGEREGWQFYFVAELIGIGWFGISVERKRRHRYARRGFYRQQGMLTVDTGQMPAYQA